MSLLSFRSRTGRLISVTYTGERLFPASQKPREWLTALEHPFNALPLSSSLNSSCPAAIAVAQCLPQVSRRHVLSFFYPLSGIFNHTCVRGSRERPL